VAGQYAIVDLETRQDPEGPVRSFTLASSRTEEEYILVSTRIRETPFKKKLGGLDVGQLVNITAPLGKFVLHSDYSRPAVLLSGGIGVTPFRSMIKYATDKQLPINITMFDSNRNQSNILYKEEFDRWVDLNKKLKIIYTLSNGETETQIVHTVDSQYLNPNVLEESIFYIFGPPGMLRAMQKLLDELRVTKNRVMIEVFTGY